MLAIRLQRIGRRNDPSFRLVAVDSRKGPKSGRFLEVLGSYDARRGQPILKPDRIRHWLSQGASLSDTAHNLLVKQKIMKGKKRLVVLPAKAVEAVPENVSVASVKNDEPPAAGPAVGEADNQAAELPENLTVKEA